MKLYQRKENDPAPVGQADPYLIKGNDGRYYLYSTGGYLYSSDSLLEGWEYDGMCLDMKDQKVCWAPSVIQIGEKYYMYYSSMDADAKDEHGEKIRVAVADSPKGPFVYVKDLLPAFSIDPHMVQTPSGLYLFYCNNDEEAERPGTYILCDKMTDPYTLEGNPRKAVWATLDEEIYMRDRFKKGQHWHTIEGAFYFYLDGTHYLMYSGACFRNPTYFIGYCTAKGPKDADLRTLEWKKYPDPDTYAPLMCKNSFVEGVGHNSVIFDQGECYVVYHGRDYKEYDEEEDTRCARIDRMEVKDGTLSVEMTP